MFKALSKRLVGSAVRKEIVKADDAEDYTYGLNTFLTTLANVLSALAIGLLTHMLVEIAVFIVVYKCIRKYVGGSHAKNAARCYISSCMIYAAVLTAIRYWPFSETVTVMMTVVSAAVMYVTAPVEAEKKPLDDIERKVFKRRSVIVVSIFLAVFFILNYAGFIPYGERFAVVTAVGIITVAIFAAVGWIMQQRRRAKAVL